MAFIAPLTVYHIFLRPINKPYEIVSTTQPSLVTATVCSK